MAVRPVPAGDPGTRRRPGLAAVRTDGRTPRLTIVDPAAPARRSAGALRLVHAGIRVYAVVSIALVATHHRGRRAIDATVARARPMRPVAIW